ncbi:MAG TPA: GNAT family N-acetyltransferase [Longimicrobiales bacterium]
MSTLATLPLIRSAAQAVAAGMTAFRETLAPATREANAAPAPLVVIRRARPADLPAMMELLDRYAREGALLPRSPEQVRQQLRDFVVAVDATGVVGCAGLRLYSPALGEVIALAVAERCQSQGVGRRLVETLLEEARALGLRRVFALTLHPGFFHRLGFRTTNIAEFPEKIALDCNGCARRAACAEIAVSLELEP